MKKAHVKHVQTGAEYIRTLQIIHLSLILGQILFAVIAAYLVYSGGFNETKDNTDAFLIAVPAMTLLFLLLSLIVPKKKLAEINPSSGLGNKLNIYRSMIIARLAMLEAPSLLAIIAYMLQGNPVYLGISLIMICIQLSLRPGKDRLINDLKLNAEERNTFNSPTI